MEKPRRLLVILDLNGTLLHRTRIGTATFTARPRVHEFLHYLFSNHDVMVWSSAMPENVRKMCAKLITPAQDEKLVALWARDKLRLPPKSYRQKVQVYKQLAWVWHDPAVQAANPDDVDYWCQENTVLIDDSMLKAASEPFNIVQLEEFEAKHEQMQSDVLGQVVKYLEVLRLQRNVSSYMRTKPFVYDADEEFDWEAIEKDMQQ